MVTQKEYDKIVADKMAEMREMNQGPGGNRGFQMRTGGWFWKNKAYYFILSKIYHDKN